MVHQYYTCVLCYKKQKYKACLMCTRLCKDQDSSRSVVWFGHACIAAWEQAGLHCSNSFLNVL